MSLMEDTKNTVDNNSNGIIIDSHTESHQNLDKVSNSPKDDEEDSDKEHNVIPIQAGK
jgi:hypothetical protein